MFNQSEGKAFNDKEASLFPSGRGWGVLTSQPRSQATRRGQRSRLIDYPKKAKKQNHMTEPECRNWMAEPAYAQEVGRRIAQRYLTQVKGGLPLAQQQELDQIGISLRSARQALDYSLEAVAEAIETKPAMLCFLENGWATEDEFQSVIDRWAEVLGKDGEEYRTRIAFMQVSR